MIRVYEIFKEVEEEKLFFSYLEANKFRPLSIVKPSVAKEVIKHYQSDWSDIQNHIYAELTIISGKIVLKNAFLDECYSLRSLDMFDPAKFIDNVGSLEIDEWITDTYSPLDICIQILLEIFS